MILDLSLRVQNLRTLDSSPTYSPIMRCIYFYQIIRLTLILPMAASLSALNTGPSDLSDGRSTGDRVCSPTATEPDCCSLGRDCIGNDKSLSQDSTTTSADHSVFATLTLFLQPPVLRRPILPRKSPIRSMSGHEVGRMSVIHHAAVTILVCLMPL